MTAYRYPTATNARFLVNEIRFSMRDNERFSRTLPSCIERFLRINNIHRDDEVQTALNSFLAHLRSERIIENFEIFRGFSDFTYESVRFSFIFRDFMSGQRIRQDARIQVYENRTANAEETDVDYSGADTFNATQIRTGFDRFYSRTLDNGHSLIGMRVADVITIFENELQQLVERELIEPDFEVKIDDSHSHIRLFYTLKDYNNYNPYPLTYDIPRRTVEFDTLMRNRRNPFSEHLQQPVFQDERGPSGRQIIITEPNKIPLSVLSEEDLANLLSTKTMEQIKQSYRVDIEL